MQSSSICSYCLNPINLNAERPIILDCQHIFCKDCLKIIELFSVSSSCPLDGIKVKFPSLNANSESLSHCCSVHSMNVKAFCSTHSKTLCEQCEKDHKNCEIKNHSLIKIIEETEKKT